MTFSAVVAILMIAACVAIVFRGAWSVLFRKAVPGPRRPARGRRVPFYGPTGHAGSYPMPGSDGAGWDGGSGGDTGGSGS
ncbi:hypothetical protein OIE66_06335 [Nonomuraea sp. NBC_01738]|uniref:hypothetical protein n=1 Tax=Nonomuraea sp. NBC_01738 TaxID=2976003 RepID=UPI002E105C64|nr:hypothetical protein OIE66_06335 [Nonomuraea sp. NBC_01738]